MSGCVISSYTSGDVVQLAGRTAEGVVQALRRRSWRAEGRGGCTRAVRVRNVPPLAPHSQGARRAAHVGRQAHSHRQAGSAHRQLYKAPHSPSQHNTHLAVGAADHGCRVVKRLLAQTEELGVLLRGKQGRAGEASPAGASYSTPQLARPPFMPQTARNRPRLPTPTLSGFPSSPQPSPPACSLQNTAHSRPQS